MGSVVTYPDLDRPVITEYPVGSVIAYAGVAAPAGWLLCDGAAVSRATYSSLFTVIGTQYGTGDGSTTFNLPNVKGRTVVMQDASDTDWDVLGETRGAKTVALSIAELAAHNHSYGNAWTNAPADGGSDINRYHVAVGVNNDHGLGTISNGSGTAHNNLQPSIVLNYIIRASAQVTVAAPPLWQPGSPTPGLPFTCTSSTRPALPFVGMVIFETDTLRGRQWDGVSWKLSGSRSPVAKLRATTIRAAGNAAWLATTFDTADEDTWNSFSGGNPTRLTCQEAGVYNIEGTAGFVGGTGSRGAGLRKNLTGASGPTHGTVLTASNVNWSHKVPVTANGVRLAVGDYMELVNISSAGGNLVIEDGDSHFAWTYVGA